MRRILCAALALAACNGDKVTVPFAFSVALSPPAATITAGKTLQLGALAKGAVKWAVTESGGGTVDANGLYTAPATPGTYHVTATSADDSTKSASATITVVPAPVAPAITLPAKITTGKTATATVPAQDGISFAWSAFNGTLADTSGTSVTVTAGDPGELVLTAIASNAAGDAAPETVAVSTVLPVPVTPAITAPFAVTTGRGALPASTATAAPGVSYKWTVANGAIDGSDTGHTVSFTSGTPGDLVLTLVASNAQGDHGAATTATVHVKAANVMELVAGAPGGFGNADDVGADARFGSNIFGIAEDPSSGSLLATDYYNFDIRKIAPDGTVTTLAGTPGHPGFSDGPGSQAKFLYPVGIAADSQGTAYVADQSNQRLRRVAPDGTTTTIAGDGNNGNADGFPLAGAQLSYPQGIAVTPDAGSIWWVDTGSSLRLLTLDAGVPWVATEATGLGGAYYGVALAPTGVLFNVNCAVEEFDAGFLWVAAGSTSQCGYQDGPGPTARFGATVNVATDPSGVAWVVDFDNRLIRSMDYDAGANEWEVSTAAGVLGDAGVDDGPIATARLNNPYSVTVRSNGAVAFGDSYTVRQLSGGQVTTIAGTPVHDDHFDGPGPSAHFSLDHVGYLATPAFEDDGTAYIPDGPYVRQLAPDGTVTTLAGSGSGAVDGLAGTAGFSGTSSLALDKKNHILYVADYYANQIRTITYDPEIGAQTVHTIAGDPHQSCNNTDTGPGLDAGFCSPVGVAVDSQGRVFVSDDGNNRIRMVERTQDGGSYDVSTVARICPFSAVVGNAAAPPPACDNLNYPAGIAFDPQDRLYIADNSNHLIKELEFDGGAWVMNVIAGTAGVCASNDGEGLDAGFCYPVGIAVDRDGKLWVSDGNNALIRKLTFNTTSGAWKVETVAGVLNRSGVKPGPLPARVNYPGGIGATPFGDIMVLDSNENSVLLVRPQ